MNKETIQKYLDSRKRMVDDLELPRVVRKGEEEGGCGVVGFCCSKPVGGKHIYEPSKQMHNRGNGKGGGIAAVGFVPEQLGVSRDVLDNYYMLHIAFLDVSVRKELEKKYIEPNFEVALSAKLDNVDDWEKVPGLEVRPPDVWRYFVKTKKAVLDKFIADNNFQGMDVVKVEDEFIGQNSFALNQEYYASLGDQQAFVLSHGKNIMILKVVGFAEAIVQYYKIEDLAAHVWIAHQRFPTRGRVWHPGGAHPFAGVNMGLVHNGDFANYHSVSEHLIQRNIYPQFLTDTEVSALMFDLMVRTYEYPLEYIIEALAPTTELDFDRLSPEKQEIYRAVQATHIHGSPDGPWFFIIARNLVSENGFQLLGITDTAMLRPQVFAFCDGEIQVGLIGSEKQAIDATLLSLSEEDPSICRVADRYWNARGGSHDDGGSFRFDLRKNDEGKIRMTVSDKFGDPVEMPAAGEECDFTQGISLSSDAENRIQTIVSERFAPGNAFAIYEMIRDLVPQWSYDEFRLACKQIVNQSHDTSMTDISIEVLTLLNDRIYPVGNKKRSHLIDILRRSLDEIFDTIPSIDDNSIEDAFRLVDFDSRDKIREPREGETTLVINAENFTAEGDDCDAASLVIAYNKGWRKFIVYKCKGQRYIGCGLGPGSDDVVIDVYGCNGDYLASGLLGASVTVHNNAQDQLGQIITKGKLVIHGDVGQTFMYGAKGADVYVRGNAAGRPLINSVGKPRVVINGTCLDFLGESFMAGDPNNGGGFVVVNGMKFDDEGNIVALDEPYPGSNLFSLASGGAAFVRDPKRLMVEQQLNGGVYQELTNADWDLIEPYLQENEKLFGIKVKDLLTVDGEKMNPLKVYRKVVPASMKADVSEEVEEFYEEDQLEEEAVA